MEKLIPLNVEAVHNYLLEKRLSITDLSKRSDVSFSRLSHALREEVPQMRPRTLYKVADALEVEPRKIIAAER